MIHILYNKYKAKYKSQSQIIRVATEEWVANEIYCPNCGNNISKFNNNKPVADFFCRICKEEFELKSKKGNFSNKIVDGSYNSMIERLISENNPNFFFLNYKLNDYQVQNFFVVPKYFFYPHIIEKRKALSNNVKKIWMGRL